MKKFKQYVEDMGAAVTGPTNVAGTGAVAGIGVGKSGEPGVSRNRKKPIILPMGKRKNPPN